MNMKLNEIAAYLFAGFAAAAVIVGTTAGSIAPSQVEPADSLQGRLVQALEILEPTERDRVILERSIENGFISEEDYRSSYEEYSGCMSTAGFTPKLHETGRGILVEMPYEGVEDIKKFDDASDSCSHFIAIVSSLYRTQVVNPGLQETADVAVACLSENGAVPDSYTTEDFLVEARGEMKSADTTGATYSTFDAYTGVNNDCLHEAGIAVFSVD